MLSYFKKTQEEDTLISEIHEFAADIFPSMQPEQELSFAISQSSIGFTKEEQYNIIEKQIKNSIKANDIYIDLINEKEKKKKNKLLKQYVSPYRQNQPETARKFLHNQPNFVHNLYSQQTERLNYTREPAKNNSPQYNWISSRYKEEKGIMNNIQKYASERVKAEANFLHFVQHKHKQSQQKSQEKWSSFLSREKKWNQEKNNQIIQKTKQKIKQQNQIIVKPSPKPEKAKMTIDQCIKKIRRDTQQLKDRLFQQSNNYFKYPKNIQSHRKSQTKQMNSDRSNYNSKYRRANNSKQNEFQPKSDSKPQNRAQEYLKQRKTNMHKKHMKSQFEENSREPKSDRRILQKRYVSLKSSQDLANILFKS